MRSLFPSLISYILLCSIFQTPLLSQEPINFEQIAEEAIEKENLDVQRQIEFDNWTLTHTKRVFIWNHVSSIIIFFVVHTIIFVGIYLAYIQFRHSIQNQKPETNASTMKIGKEGVEVSSSIVGLLILIISLVFFYLYIENVYPVRIVPISELSSDEAETE